MHRTLRSAEDPFDRVLRAARRADDAERLYLDFAAECHQQAADPPTEPLTRADLWNEFMRRAQERGLDAEAGPWLDF